MQLTVFADRLEVHSPGSLPNGVTVEKAKEGLRVPRNPNIVNILRDYDFMEAVRSVRDMDDSENRYPSIARRPAFSDQHRGMGIRRKVIPLTRAHNGTDPEFDATEDYFKVTLRKEATPAPASG